MCFRSRLFYLIGCIVLSIFGTVSAQKSCGSEVYLHHRLQLQGISQDQYAAALIRSSRPSLNARTLRGPIRIATVFHILHYASPPNSLLSAYKLPYDQVTLQLRILNQSYSQQHEQVHRIPSELMEISAGDIGISFEIAARDTLGFPTDGVVYVSVSLSDDDISIPIEEYVRELSRPWDPSRYLNVYVIPDEVIRRSGADFSGLSSFPIANIEGLEPSLLSNSEYVSTNWDGILVATEAFGSNHSLSIPGTKGRSLVHEAGHYLGLFHTWGNPGGCLADDYCADTFRQLAPTDFNAPCSPIPNSCGSRDLFENYMDYSSDLCMLLFTKCQAVRMRQALLYSSNRFSLWQSADPITPPLLHAVDAGIITRPNELTPPCEEVLQGRLRIGNYGTEPITSLRVAFLLNNQPVAETNYTISIPTISSGVPWGAIDYGPIVIDTYGTHQLEARIVSVNETTDQQSENDTLKAEILHAELLHNPVFNETFQEAPKWYLPSHRSIVKLTTSSSDSSDRILAFKLSGSPSDTYQKSYTIQSPVLDLRRHPSDVPLTLSLRYSHQVDLKTTLNTLLIGARSGADRCLKDTYELIYLRRGLDLHSNGLERRPSEPPYYAGDWTHIRIPLPISDPFLQLMISVTNGQGGDIYLDDLSIDREPLEDLESQPLRLTQVTYPSLSCGPKQLMLTTFSNYTAHPIDLRQAWVRLKYSAELFSPWIQGEGRLEAWRSQEELLSLSTESIEGLTQVSIELTYSERRPSDNLIPLPDNQKSNLFFVSHREGHPPLSDSAEQPNSFRGWKQATSVDSGSDWQYFRSSNGAHLQAPLFDRARGDEQSFFRLFSPQIDLIGLSEAWLSFRVANAERRGASNKLRLFVFEDCRAFPSALLYEQAGTKLSTHESEEYWFPISSSSWRYEYVDLSKYVNKKINLLFIATTDQGPSNNLYLDDLTVSEQRPIAPRSSDPPRPWVVVYPNPTSNPGTVHFLFNLDAPEQVRVSYIDLSGRVIMKQVLDNVETQLIEQSIHLPNDQVHLLRFETSTQKHTLRLIVK